MKKIIVLLCSMIIVTSTHAADISVGLEIGIGFGKSGSVSIDDKKFTLCKNRSQNGLLTVMLRGRYNEIELHGGRWWHDSSAACDRSSNVVGVGYVLDTDNHSRMSNDRFNASWTPGLAYVWGKDKRFTRQQKDDVTTNWRMHGNWQVFNRLAVGVGTSNLEVDDVSIELAVHRYGSFDPNHGESFVTLGVFGKRFEDHGDRSKVDGSHKPKIKPSTDHHTVKPIKANLAPSGLVTQQANASDNAVITQVTNITVTNVYVTGDGNVVGNGNIIGNTVDNTSSIISTSTYVVNP